MNELSFKVSSARRKSASPAVQAEIPVAQTQFYFKSIAKHSSVLGGIRSTSVIQNCSICNTQKPLRRQTTRRSSPMYDLSPKRILIQIYSNLIKNQKKRRGGRRQTIDKVDHTSAN